MNIYIFQFYPTKLASETFIAPTYLSICLPIYKCRQNMEYRLISSKTGINE